jgi:pimeloyl-ACP methyl ester carboxylesterase
MVSEIKFKKRYLVYIFMISYLIFCQSCMTMRMTKKETKTFFESSKTSYVDQTVSIEDYKIHYIQTGNEKAPTLFFVHGSPGSWDAFKKYLKDTLLLQKYRMIAIDRPGFGYSNFRDPKNLPIQSNRIESFIKTIDNQQPIVLVGHSMGGPVIAKLAVNNPRLYSHLVILAGAIDPAAEKPEKWRAVFNAAPLKYLIPGALLPSNKELWWLKEDLIMMKPKLKNIRSKINIIHGTKDPLVPYSNVGFMQKEFVNAASIETLSIENANHFIPWEHYDKIRNVLLGLQFQL